MLTLQIYFLQTWQWSKLFKYIGINNHVIELVNSQQPIYQLIHSLRLVELQALKAYIKTNLANGFIKPSMSSKSTPIIFDQKLDRFFQLCINYKSFNNLTIKNQYLLPLVRELLDRLERVRQFIQSDLTSAYHQIKVHKGDK